MEQVHLLNLNDSNTLSHGVQRGTSQWWTLNGSTPWRPHKPKKPCSKSASKGNAQDILDVEMEVEVEPSPYPVASRSTFFIKSWLKYSELLIQTSSRCSLRLVSIFYPSSSVCGFYQFGAWWFLKFSLKLVNLLPSFFSPPWEKSLYDQLCEVTEKTDRDQETRVSLNPITNPRVRHGEKTEMKGTECLKVCLSFGLTSGGSLLSYSFFFLSFFFNSFLFAFL